MPAVQLIRLKTQLEGLSRQFSRPVDFVESLRNILDQYSDRTYRPGQAVQPAPSADRFQVPNIVIRQLELAIQSWASQTPQYGLEIADRLWTESKYEMRLAGIMILGALPPEQIQEVQTRLAQWGEPQENWIYLDTLFTQGTKRIRKDNPTLWLDQIKTWIYSGDTSKYKLGLEALLPFIRDPAFENMPVIFNLITGPLQEQPKTLQRELTDVLAELAKKSPTETAYFLRQILSLSSKPDLVRLVRRCLPGFPEETQNKLRSVLLALPR